MKKFFVVTLIALFTAWMILPSSSFADTSGHISHNHEDGHEHHELEGMEVSSAENEFGVLYTPCPEGGRHTMYEHGRGDLYQNGKQIINAGYVHQCSKCHKAFVSQYDPENSGRLGTYGVEYLSYQLGTSYTMRYPDYVDYNQSTSPTVAPWDGYVWY